MFHSLSYGYTGIFMSLDGKIMYHHLVAVLYDASLSRDRIPSPRQFRSLFFSFHGTTTTLSLMTITSKRDAGRPTGYTPCFYFPCNFKSPLALINPRTYPEMAARWDQYFGGVVYSLSMV